MMADIDALLKQIDEIQSGTSTPDDLLKRLDEVEGASGLQSVRKVKGDGEVFRKPDGTLTLRYPGYVTSDPDTIARVMEGETPADVWQDDIDRQRIAQNPVVARGVELVQGVPFAGEWIDEGLEKIDPGRAKSMRGLSDAMERQNPYESATLNITGGVISAVPLAMGAPGAAAAKFVQGGKSVAGRIGRGLALSVPGGAVEGALSFAGRGETREERMEGAKTGAVVGGGLAGVLGVFAPLIGAGAASLAKRIKKLDAQTIADQFGISQPAARVVKRYLQNDDLDAAQDFLSRAGDDAMLAEAGPATRQGLDDAMATGGEALAIARPRVAERMNSAATGWLKTLDDVLGTADGGIKGAAKDIARGSAAARKAAYDRAYAQPTPMAGPAAEAIQGVLDRITPETFEAAMKEAAAEARDAGLRNFNILAQIDDAGNVVFSQPPSVQELDYLARGLSNVVDAGTDKMTGQMSPAAARAARQAQALRDAMKEGVEGYETALKLGGDKIRETQALVMGRKLLNEATTVEDVRAAMNGASDAAKAAARKGLRENLEAVMGRARATIADLEAGAMDFETGMNNAAQAVAAIRNLTSKNNFQKSRFVLGTDAKRLFDELEKVGDALVLRAAVARNSATAIRTAGREAIQAEVEPGLLRRTAGNLGNPLDAAKEVSQTIAGIDPRSLTDQQRAYFAEIADALTQIRGADANRALFAVRKAMQGQPLKDAEAELIGRVVTGSSGVGLYQSGKQALGPQ